MTKKVIRPKLTEDEYAAVLEYREEVKRHRALLAECEEHGVPVSDVRHYWYKSQRFSLFVKNQPKTYQQIRDEIVADMKAHAPVYPVLHREPMPEGHLLVIDPADVHIGKLAMSFETGEDYDSLIAVQRVREGVAGILQKVQGFQVDQILLLVGNDILHIDTPKRTTTAGTPQDTSGQWFSNFLLAKRLYVEIIELLVNVANVHVQYDPSNHDYTNGFFLADTISSWFSRCEQVTFDISLQHRKYYRYHNNLIGSTHGDGAKTNDLPLLMAHEAPVWWGECKHKVFLTHHLHHRQSKDIMSVTIEVLRSPSGTDGWHHKAGYQHSPKAIEGYLFSKQDGQIAKISHFF